MAPSQDQIIDIVLAFVNAQSWAESRQIIEANRDVLLSDTADVILIYLLTEYRENENTGRRLEEHRKLLARCRREGIDAAFADLVAPRDPSNAVPGPLTEIVLAFINAQAWDESKQIIEANSDELLTDAADAILADLLEHKKDNEDATRVLEEHRMLLLRCRREGIDAAFADRLHPPTAKHESELGTQLEALAEELEQLTKLSDMPRAITVCQAALELVSRDSQPELWAALQRQLGDSLYQNPLEERAENQEQAIHHYQRALEVYTRNDLPEDWAMTHHNLGVAYRNRILGDRGQNLEEAIGHYELAMEVYTREAFPERWATTQNNLANAYSDHMRVDRAEDLTEAVLTFINAQSWTESKQIVENYSNLLLTEGANEVLVNLLEQYKDNEDATRILEDHRRLLLRCRREGIDAAFADRLGSPAEVVASELDALLEELERLTEPGDMSRAVAVCQAALNLISRDEQSELWAELQVQLGYTLAQNPLEDRAENLERAIHHFEQALEVRTRQDFPWWWATIQNNMACAYLYRIREDRAENIERAIYHSKQALEVRTRQASSQDWADTQNNLASAYLYRIRGDRAQSLEEAIHHFEQALKVRTHQDFPEQWAMIQNNLANAYWDRIREDKAQNLEQAIYHYEQALRVYTDQDFSVQWAATQNNLANAYRDRIREERVQNLELAIHHYEQALRVYTRENFPDQWATTQNNLACAYSDRIRGDRAKNLEGAIYHFEQALEVYKRQSFPQDWAMIQNGLGLVYWKRIRGDRAKNLEQAIRYYEQALEIRTREAFPEQWTVIQNNLGLVYWKRIRGDGAKNLEQAIRHYEQALEIRTREAFPQDWAGTQMNLASAYWNRIRGERAENIELAIHHYEQALDVYTRRDFPEQWAMTQHNLAITYYHQRIRGDRAQNIELAIHHYEQALKIRAAKAFPQDCRDTAYILGYLFYEEHRFTEARKALTTAHEAVEALRGEIQREGARRDLAEQNANLYARLVHCCLLEGDEEAAFKYAVAGKGQAFVDMLATARFDLSAAGADDPELAEDLRQAKELRQQIDNLLAQLSDDNPSTPDGTKRRALSEMRPDLRALQDQEAAFWEDMSYKYPALTATQKAPVFTAQEARALAKDPEAKLVEYYRHAGGWCAFIVTLDSLRYVPLPEVSDDRMERLFVKWLECIEWPFGRRSGLSYEPLYLLHEALIKPLRPYLTKGEAVVLAPFAWLHLLPLGGALNPKTGRYVADEYRLAFTPSLAALRVARDQSRRGDSSTGRASFERLLSVAYPGDDPESEDYLESAVEEAEAISGHFAPQVREELYEDAATPAAVLANARGRDVIHLSCHGWFDPEAPEQSGLILSGGWLTVQRVITELRLEQTRLVTVSACSSGRAQIRQGEEHVGLLQAIMSAGARMVVASLWSVDEASTRILFEAFYEKRAAGIAPADALAEAARLVRSSPGWEHPYYWAAFQASGLAYEANEPTSAQRPADVEKRIGETRQKSSVKKRGGSVVDAETMVGKSLILLEQMTWNPDKVREALDREGQREKVVAELRDLAEQADGIATEADLLALADGVHQLVENTALAGFWLKGVDVEAAREERKKTIRDEYHEAASRKGQHVQKDAQEMTNRMLKAIEGLEQPAAQEVLNPQGEKQQ